MTPTVYMHKSGVATLGELSKFKSSDPVGYAQLRQYAVDEMTAAGIPVKENV